MLLELSVRGFLSCTLNLVDIGWPVQVVLMEIDLGVHALWTLLREACVVGLLATVRIETTASPAATSLIRMLHSWNVCSWRDTLYSAIDTDLRH